MRTLKKVLALTLVLAMTFALCVGAVDFVDQKDIDVTEQVSMMAALGVIKGDPSGTFRPDDIVTRAEMAKMIYVIRTGTDDGATYYKGTSSIFSDVKGHWAEGYINYCAAAGIVAGTGAGKFEPDAPVTGLQAAKMALVLMGYTEEKAGLTGLAWADNTNRYAAENGLWAEFAPSVEIGCTRQYAAVVLYNAIFADTVTWSKDAEAFVKNVIASGGVVRTETVGQKYLKLQPDFEGTLIGAEGFSLDGAIDDETILVWDGDETVTDFSFDGGLELIGQEIKVVYKVVANKAVVYGIASTGTSKVFDLTMADIEDGSSDDKIKFGGKSYALDDYAMKFINYADNSDADANVSGDVYTGLGTSTAAKGNEVASSDLAVADLGSAVMDGTPVKLVDSDGNNKIDFAFIAKRELTQITGIDSKKIGLSNATIKILNEDDEAQVVYPEDLKVDDIVWFSYNDLTNVMTIEKAEIKSVTVTGTNTDGNIRVDGTWLKPSTATPIDDPMGDFGTDALSTGKYDLVMDGARFILWQKTDGDTAPKNYAYLVSGRNETSGLDSSSARVEMMILGEDDSVVYDVSGIVLEDGSKGDIKADVTGAVGTMVAYEIKDGKVKLFQNISMVGAKTASYDADAEVMTFDGVGYLVDKDSVIIARTGAAGNDTAAANADAANWTVYAGTALDTDTADLDDSFLVTKKSGGFEYVEAILLNSTTKATVVAEQNGGKSDDMYGYVTDYMIGSENDTDFVEYTLWTGKETIIKEMDTNTPSVAVGEVVLYTLKADGTVNEIAQAALGGTSAAENRAKFVLDQVKTVGTTRLALENAGYINIADDMKIFVIDTDAGAGVDDSTIRKISVGAAGDAYNIAYSLDADGKIDFIVIDTNESLASGDEFAPAI